MLHDKNLSATVCHHQEPMNTKLKPAQFLFANSSTNPFYLILNGFLDAGEHLRIQSAALDRALQRARGRERGRPSDRWQNLRNCCAHRLPRRFRRLRGARRGAADVLEILTLFQPRLALGRVGPLILDQQTFRLFEELRLVGGAR